MKTLNTFVTVSLLAAKTLHAQLVADGATNTLANVTNSVTGNLTVGTNGSFTMLVLSNNVLVTNSGSGNIGLNATALSNEVRLISATARWRMDGFLMVGNNGSFNRLAISNGALVSGIASFIGGSSGSSNNLAVVSGGGSLLTNSSSLTIGGSGGSGNQLWIVAGGRVEGFQGQVSGPGNLAVVTGAGSQWNTSRDFYAGLGGENGRVRIEEGGRLSVDGGYIGANSMDRTNEVLVTGATSLWSNRLGLIVGANAAFNRLVVSNGGWVVNTVGTVGANASATNNEVVVTGSDSTWSNRTDFVVGNLSTGNRLVVSNGGTVIVPGNGILGLNTGANGNAVIVTDPGSQLQAGNDLRVGTNSSLNSLLIAGGATASARIAELGYHTGAVSNSAVITGAGSRLDTTLNTIAGRNGAGNRLTISEGGVVSSFSAVLGLNAGGSNTLAVVTGSGSLWSNQQDCVVGSLPPGNRLVISNGGFVRNHVLGVIGDTSTSFSNQVVVAGPGSTWQSDSQIRVGTGGRGNQLTISDGGSVFCSTGILGLNATGSNNLALVTGVGSIWSNAFDLIVGNAGSGNSFLLNNGGGVVSSNTFIGFGASGRSNMVVMTGAGASWLNQNRTRVGESGSGNFLVVSNGAVLGDTDGSLGETAASSNNTAIVTGANSAWTNLFNFRVGSFGSGNQLVVENGGQIANDAAFIGAIGSRNTALLTGAGTLWTSAAELVIGDQGAVNLLVVSNGAMVLAASGIMGTFIAGSNNAAVVTGTGSTWSTADTLFVGNGGPRNQLVVSNAGTVFVGTNLFLGQSTFAGSNRIVVTGGTLSVTNPSHTGRLDVRRGTNVFNSGLILADHLMMTNRGANFVPSTFGSNTTITIPASGTASPYPATIASSLAGVVTKVVVTLSNLSHTFPADLDVLLVNPTSGQKVMLMSDIGDTGGTDLTNVRYTFDDSATLKLPTNAPSGTYRPNDAVPGETMPGPAPAGPYSTNLSTFNGQFASGSWRLYINDDAGPDGGSLVGWSLQITTDESQSLDGGFFEFNGGTFLTRGATINNGDPFVVGASGTTPAIWDVRAGAGDHYLEDGLIVGGGASFCQLIHTNGALLTNSQFITMSSQATSRSNRITVAGPGSRLRLARAISVGNAGPDNRLLVSDGATITSAYLSSIGFQTAATNNEVNLTGSGTSWDAGFSLTVGNSGSGNRLLVSDGALLSSFEGHIGASFFASNNLALVSGGGSRWDIGQELRVGDGDVGNHLVISNGGTVTVGQELYVGFDPAAINNWVSVSGGTLLVTNASTNCLLEIRRGTGVLNTGLIEADLLRMTNGNASKLEFNGGTLAIKSSRVSIGNPLIVGDGASPATLQLAGNGTHDFSGTLGLIVTNNATLTGNGTVLAQLQIRPGATLSPGASVGKISLSSAPFLSGNLEMEISKNGAALTNDQIQLNNNGALTYGGALTVTHLGPTLLAGGDKFKLFDAAAYAGSFTAITLPPLASGLSWINNLQLDGTIEVFAPPPTGAGFALSFDGTNDSVVVPPDSRLNAYPLIATAWIKTAQATGEVGIINKYVAGSSNGWHVGLINGEIRAWYVRDSANRVGSEGGGLNGGPAGNGAWHHVAFTVDAVGGHLYVDGFLRDEVGWSGTPGACTTTQSLSFGRYPGGAGEFFKGALEEVTIRGSLTTTQSEIKRDLDRGLIGTELGLVSYHRFNEGTGGVAENSARASGTLTDGALQNGVAWVPGLTLRPAVVTRVATAVGVNSATLHGVVNPGLTGTSSWFEWGTTTNYGNLTPAQFLGSSGSNTNISQSITGLTENVSYHFRAAASNLVGTSFGVDKSFVATGTNMLSPRVGHTATLLPNGKVLVVGGRGQNQEPVSSAELYDPASGKWAITTPMSTVRHGHTATVLPNGKVLVAGGEGQDFTPAHSSAELFDPATETWSPTGSMSTNRYEHTATLLSDGKVLVAGGYRGISGQDPTAELYDPATGNWTETGALLTWRYHHTATLLPSGQVLLAGGGSASGIVSSAELYDPISGIWANTGSMTTNRLVHTATLLRNGKVLAVGGRSGTSFLRSAELYDPVSGTWTNTGAMLNYRIQHTATLLPNGKVFASGDGIGIPSLYDPLLGTWTDVPGPDPNSGATATLLLDGNVLVAGGVGGFVTDGDPTAVAEVFVPTNMPSWTVTAPMATARGGHSATLLSNALVLVASFGNSEIYNPSTGIWTNTGALIVGRSNHTATLLPNGKVLAVGGQSGPINQLTSAELYTPSLGTWTNTGSLATNRTTHTATFLGNGEVLVAGGAEGFFFTSPSRSAELYDPATGTWTNTGAMTTNHQEHTATLLPNGKVLVAGGGTADAGFSANAELYDPATRAWTAVAPMALARTRHFAVLLPSGKVLVAGGLAPSTFLPAVTRSAELFDPETGTWESAGLMGSARQNARATLLPNGKVLVTGGRSGGTFSVEIYDPSTGEWTSAMPMGAERFYHTSTLLPNGKLLVTGGFSGGNATNRAELYDIGLITSNIWKPQILTATLSAGGSLAMTGAQFRGLSEGSGGNGGQDSPTDYPIVQLRRLDNGQLSFIFPTSWAANSFAAVPVLDFQPGWAMVTVFANGIPSDAKLLNISAATPFAFQLTGVIAGLNGQFQFGFTNAPGARFTVLAATNPSLPVSNWSVLNSATEVSPGLYQFSDPQATNNPQRYYRVRWP